MSAAQGLFAPGRVTATLLQEAGSAGGPTGDGTDANIGLNDGPLRSGPQNPRTKVPSFLSDSERMRPQPPTPTANQTLPVRIRATFANRSRGADCPAPQPPHEETLWHTTSDGTFCCSLPFLVALDGGSVLTGRFTLDSQTKHTNNVTFNLNGGTQLRLGGTPQASVRGHYIGFGTAKVDETEQPDIIWFL